MAEANDPRATLDWGTPDPCDADAYPAVKGTPLSQWAWEFLRRREDYRRRWLQLTASHGRKEIHDTEQGSETRWLSPTEALRVEFRVCAWAANNTLDPTNGRAPLFEGSIVREVLAAGWRSSGSSQVMIEFDATLPLEPQLEYARQFVRKESKHCRRCGHRLKSFLPICGCSILKA